MRMTNPTVIDLAVLSGMSPLPAGAPIMANRKDAAAMFGMSADTLTRLTDDGAITAYTLPGNHRSKFYDIAEVRAAFVACPNAKNVYAGVGA